MKETRLFAAGERTRTSGGLYNEPDHSFLDTSGWPSVERVRQFWEGWFSQYPEDRRASLVGRFQSCDDHTHGPRNVALSSVMHGHFNALSFASDDRPITLTHHPVAAHPPVRGIFPFCEERYFDSASGKMATVERTMTVAQFFRLPEGWPHFDRDPGY